MNNLRAYDEDMAQKIMDEMFVFETSSTSTAAASSCCCAKSSRSR